ncbi:UvrD-helicase domain-containing protein [Rhizobium glycinendophyticum]|uniref:DNA 3'-5' helicase II n=1 Tax=Rhizobium glycinendophyticum TaxID=2589807 RepID=A0A504TRG2_9HYPH|nr:UvrD-helicase domain-containing protein [Rhizobium glycinendophyticum]TPP04954.1 ATP-dependent helicase [Rhizobium glycinendophyticum]
MSEELQLNPAEAAAAEAWSKLQSHLKDGSSFVFEAGAGAGKTYSLIAALRHILADRARELIRRHQQVACITYTNVARDMIIAQTDGHPAIYCETTHAFAWFLISGFQKRLIELVPTLAGWQGRTDELANAADDTAPSNPDAPPTSGINAVGYALGRRSIEGRTAKLHHDDIFPLFIELMNSTKFRNALTSRFPIILVDEYQDTNEEVVAAFKKHFLGKPGAPQFGFFGDHWQKIYGDGCGSIQHASLKRVDKKANFRSAKPIVDCLNKIRPDLKQAPRDPDSTAVVRLFHTNAWIGTRRTGAHWGGDLPEPKAAAAFQATKEALIAEGWDFKSDTKVLMLTHRALANELGYASMRDVFRFNDSFARKGNDVIKYFHEHLEPAAKAFLGKRFGAMFHYIDTQRPVMKGPADKARWSTVMSRLCELREAGTVGDVIVHLQNSGLPLLGEAVSRIENDLAMAKQGQEPLSDRLQELDKLHAVRYREIIALCEYLDGHSPFETKHGVKGDQFENVLVVFGRGWSDYDFNAFLEMVGDPHRIAQERDRYERYRNLFYVAVSRPKRRLALLFTQRLTPSAMTTLTNWFHGHPIQDLGSTL